MKRTHSITESISDGPGREAESLDSGKRNTCHHRLENISRHIVIQENHSESGTVIVETVVVLTRRSLIALKKVVDAAALKYTVQKQDALALECFGLC